VLAHFISKQNFRRGNQNVNPLKTDKGGGMAYREVAVRIGTAILVAVMMLQVPGYMWKSLSSEEKQKALVMVTEKFKDDFPFCKIAKMWIVYDQDTNNYQIWMRCIDKEVDT
jgi:hypothetical protein